MRVRTDLRVVVAFANGAKQPARVVDVSVGGMHLECASVPEYGERLTVIASLNGGADWALLPGTVRWFTSAGFGVEFNPLTQAQARALARFVDGAAA